jgi:hypothetical protein
MQANGDLTNQIDFDIRFSICVQANHLNVILPDAGSSLNIERCLDISRKLHFTIRKCFDVANGNLKILSGSRISM